ncbi:MAG: MBL fold metallo-hydrolase [Anaerolineae bacterium]|nr:MBL fold metallo-hydrolase [Anaerolineae bacterium]
MEVVPGIHRIKCNFGVNRAIYVHLFIGEDAAMLVDTACAHNPQQDILPYMASIGFDPADLTYILISHSDLDHQGGNQPMKAAAPQALLTCHNLDRPWIEDTEALIAGRYSQFEVEHGIGYGEAGKDGIRADTLSHPLDMTLEGGETFRLSADWSVEAIHTPGHTWGHLAVYDPRSRFLAAGEAALWTTILDSDWQPALPPTYCYVDPYLATLDRLLALDIDVYSPAHWPVQRGADVGQFLRESRNYCLLVERKLLDLARQQSFTLREAIDRLGPEVGTWPAATNIDFSYGAAGNLHRLAQRGLLKTSRSDAGLVVWRAA